MSLDRYIAVCHSFSIKLGKFRNKSSVIVIILCVWIIAILSCIPVISNTNNTGVYPNCRCKLVIAIAIYSFNYFSISQQKTYTKMSCFVIVKLFATLKGPVFILNLT